VIHDGPCEYAQDYATGAWICVREGCTWSQVYPDLSKQNASVLALLDPDDGDHGVTA